MYFGDAYPFITPGDMHVEKHLHTTARGLSEEGARFLATKRVPAGSICVSCIGWQMGEVVVVRAESFTNQQLNTLIPNGSVNPDFLYYSLKPRKEELLALGSAIGVRTPILKKSAFGALRILVPTARVQKKIAFILSAYDDLIENNQRRIKTLEAIAQNVYREWFVKLRFPGHEKAPFVASPLGRAPEGWEVAALGALGELKKDNFAEKDHATLPLLDLARMRQRTLSVAEIGTSSELSTSRIIFEEDDLLFGSIRPYLHKVALAPFRGVTNVSVLVIRPRGHSLKAFLAVLLSSIDVVRWADQHATGTKMPVVKWDMFQRMQVLVACNS
jgi:type I restriction enzyme S subunit